MDKDELGVWSHSETVALPCERWKVLHAFALIVIRVFRHLLARVRTDWKKRRMRNEY